MITDKEGKRLDKIKRQVTARIKVSRADAQWALDLARREGAILEPITVVTAMARGFDCAGIKTKKA